jgi:glycosyltransferase involved in cell wall biosynthesis
MPRFSAIVPNYNDAAHIGEALESLAKQNFPFAEILIIDDGSTDNSVAVITKLIANQPRTRLLRNEKNMGVVATLNRGIHEASGDYLFLCSANDTYHPKMTLWCAEMLSQHPDAGIISGNADAWDEAKKMSADARIVPLPQVRALLDPERMVACNRRVGIHFSGGANALRRDLVLQFGALHPELRWHCDWFLYHMLSFSAGCAFVPEAFSTIRLEGKKSYSSGFLNWPQEREVIRSIVRLLKQYPDQAKRFQRSALLPRYDVRELPLLMESSLRWFVSPLLAWRMVAHSVAYKLKYIVPRSVLMACRRYVRI